MRRFNVIMILILLLYPGYAAAIITNLAFAGRGEVNYLGFIKVYSAELYVDKQMTADVITSADYSKCLVLTYDVSIDSEDIVKGANTVLGRQHSTETLNRLRPSIELLHASYENVKDGDSYSLCYDAGRRNTTLSFNGREVVTIDSAEFANLYFGIWLGPVAPIDESLRDNLLASLQ